MNPTTSKTTEAPTTEAPEATDATSATLAKGASDASDVSDEAGGEAEGRRAPGDGDGPGHDSSTDTDSDPDLDFDPKDDDVDGAPSGLGAAAAAVVAAGLGVVGLTGAWSGRVAAERETLLGQMKTASGGSVAQQISEIYGDAWHSTALVNGLFALLALLVGVFALVRPAFGAPTKDPQPGWVRAVATAGIALGVLGVLISVGMYFDLIVALPTASAAG
ncbi:MULTISPECIES: hypothetical protein [unclassified Streptomyces]|uniref:hypothetical protein n=1 Tax=unclassified Streptomyces TaxID=2593676 RepID=UPI002257044E|nr:MULTISPECIES: hypothetical protein [unclassified Streptomyces]MCX4532458.1 hypothetical protein [Streptomyces sp. NBC_01669]WSA02053.1 hypothetical protein OHA79_31920 [Streptomyces sp. NBC_00841]